MADAQEHYQMVLDDLIARRAKLDAAISAIQEAMGLPSSGSLSAGATPAGGSSDTLRSDSFFGMTVVEAAKKYLAVSKRTRTAQEVTDALKGGGYTFATGTPLATVTSVLHRSDAKGGEIIRVSKGTWGLAEWYPGRAKRNKNADKNGPAQTPSTESTLEPDVNAPVTTS